MSGRDGDTFGVGYFHLNLSEQPPHVFQEEAGIEMFYNIQVTPWPHLSPDLQVIFNPGGTDDHRTAVVAGIRTQVSM